MAEEKALLKKDIILITKINERMHYNNMSEVKSIHNAVIEKKMFSTSMGQRYIKKLEQIMAGSNDYKCLFCSSEVTDKTVICSVCLDKIKPSQIKKEEQPVIKAVEQKPEQKSGHRESLKKIDIKKSVENTKNKITEKLDSPDVENAKNEVSEKLKNILYKVKEFWKGLSKKGKLITIGVVLVCGITVIGVSANKPGTSVNQSAKEISSVDDAMEVVESLYSSEEYAIKYEQKLHPAEGMFEGEIGKYCGESWANTNPIDAYIFSVQNKEKPYYSCICYVSIDGRVIANGSLIYEADTSAYFRIR